MSPKHGHGAASIHIKKQNRGKFTAYAKAHGETVKQAEAKILAAPKGKYSPALRKEANFARNFGH